MRRDCASSGRPSAKRSFALSTMSNCNLSVATLPSRCRSKNFRNAAICLRFLPSRIILPSSIDGKIATSRIRGNPAWFPCAFRSFSAIWKTKKRLGWLSFLHHSAIMFSAPHSAKTSGCATSRRVISQTSFILFVKFPRYPPVPALSAAPLPVPARTLADWAFASPKARWQRPPTA